MKKGKPDKMSYWTIWSTQTRALLFKNVRVLFRSRILFLLFALLSPALGPIASALIYRYSEQGFKDQDSGYGRMQMDALPIEMPGCGIHCPMIAFSPMGPKYQDIMKKLSESNGFEYGKDVVGFENDLDIAQYFLEQGSSMRQRPFVVGIAFDSNPSDQQPWIDFYKHPHSISYTILHFKYGMFEGAFTQSMKSHHFAGIQVAVDQAILSFTQQQQVSYQAQFQFMNSSIAENIQIQRKANGFDTPYQIYGRDYLLQMQVMFITSVQPFAFIPIMSLALSIVGAEKRQKLLEPLRRMGLMEGAYWTAMYLPMMVLSAVVGCVFVAGSLISSHYLSMKLFASVDMWIQFLTSFTFSLAMAAYGFFISSIFSRSLFVNIAQGVVIIVLLVSNLVIFLLPGMYPMWMTLKISDWGHAVSLLFPWISFGEIWIDHIYVVNPTILNDFKEGIRYGSSFFTGHPLLPPQNPQLLFQDWKSSPTTLFYTIWLLASVVVLMILAWYLNQTLTTQEGFSLPWYFFVLKSYWTGRPVVKKKNQVQGDFIALEQTESRETETIRAIKLSKMYKTTSAVKELSMVLEKGKIYALLGHNGCGKTTTINMLSGVTTPSFGNAFIFGHDVFQEMTAIRPLMGCCAQSDFLYPALTAAEHVCFFASFRNCNTGASVTNYVDDKLSQVELLDAKNRKAGGFSGGMKRRLSLILSTIGDDLKIYFLDEPTTGLDPLSRRNVWKVIETLKKKAVVILTTHSMEEADYLADEISIMHQGQIKAMGTSLFLKNRYGNGYQISVMPKQIKQNELNAIAHEQLEQWLTQVLPGSQVVSSAAGRVTVTVDPQATAYLKEFLRLLQNEQELDWGISNSTLEEVFLKLCVQNKGVNHVEKEATLCRICTINDADMCTLFTANGTKVVVEGVVCNDCANGTLSSSQPVQTGSHSITSFSHFKDALQERSLLQKKPVSVDKNQDVATRSRARYMTIAQMKAILIKNARLDLRMKKTNICIVLMVVLLNIGFGLLSSLIMSSTATFDMNKLSRNCTVSVFMDGSKPSCDPQHFLGVYANLTDGDTLIEKSASLETEFQGILMDQFSNLGLPDANNMLKEEFTAAMKRQLLFLQNGLPTFWNATQLDRLHTKSDNQTFYAQLNSVSSVQELQDKVSRHPKLTDIPERCRSKFRYTQLDYRRGLKGIVLDDPLLFFREMSVLYPDVVIQVDEFEKKNGKMSYKLLQHRTQMGHQPPSLHLLTKDLQSQNVCYTAIPKRTYWDTDSIKLAPLAYMINQMSNSYYDDLNNVKTGRVFDTLPPVKSDSIVTQYRQLPPLVGLDQLTSGNLSSLFILVILFSTFFMMPRLVLLWTMEKTDNLVDMMRIQGLSPLVYWLTNYVYGLWLNGVLCLITFIVGLTSKAAYTPVQMMVMFINLILWAHTLVCMALILSSVFKKPITASLLSFIIYITIAIVSVSMLLSANQGTGGLDVKYCLFPPFGFVSAMKMTMLNFPHKPTFIYSILVWVASSTVMGLIGLVVHLMKPSSMGASPLESWIEGLKTKSPSPITENDQDSNEKCLDQNVLLEQERISRQDANLDFSHESSAIRLSHLRKVFGPNQVGIKDLSLDIKFGPNGAGKSTSISCFTGLTRPMSGSIRIAGQDISTLKRKWDYIGVCPQMDIIWPDLTIEEHLLFYCRLRGIPSGQLTGAARRIAQDVGLDGDPFKQQAQGLSGGMKRRLSIAIALTADPRIIVLDEPSTGLDPETRHSIWNIIDEISKRKDRCIVITTHSMEEADALCDRIGIICTGKLRVLGNQMYLKNKFGDGLKLTLRLGLDYDRGNSENNADAIQVFTDSTLQKCKETIEQYEMDQLSKLDTLVQECASFAHRYYKSTTHHQLIAASRHGQQGLHWDVTVKYAVPQEIDALVLFDCVEKIKAHVSVSDWSISETTLDDVFITVAEQFR